jgi:hypothetical protein
MNQLPQCALNRTAHAFVTMNLLTSLTETTEKRSTRRRDGPVVQWISSYVTESRSDSGIAAIFTTRCWGKAARNAAADSINGSACLAFALIGAIDRAA